MSVRSSFTKLNTKRFLSYVVIASLGLAKFAGAAEATADTPETSSIIAHYLEASQVHAVPGESSVEVDIAASIPKLKEDGRLRALRVMSRFGKSSYRVLGFQGSNTVKNQVIARYLQAEQQNQSNSKLEITPANYKFHYKGAKVEDGRRVYIFALTPRNSGIGLFRGEMWLDADSYLPIYEKGRLTKNPSIFFKKVDFERAFALQNGHAVPQRMNSVITTRVVGRVELNVNYSNYAESPYPESEGAFSGFGNLSSR